MTFLFFLRIFIVAIASFNVWMYAHWLVDPKRVWWLRTLSLWVVVTSSLNVITTLWRLFGIA